MEWILVCLVISILTFILMHLRPLRSHEVLALSKKRRTKAIHSYFSFTSYPIGVNVEFKKKMKSTGRFYRVAEDVSTFPAVAAGLLKYKKHEWIIMGFEKNKEVVMFWVNKGPDNMQVFSLLDFNETVQTAYNIGANTVIVIHNHPNPNPNRYAMHSPSDKDKESAQYLAEILNSKEVNLVEFVCERGCPHQFYTSPTNSFFPLTTFQIQIQSENGKRWLANLKLHWERLVA